MLNLASGRLAGRGVAIVGGASGLGRAMAIALAREGAIVTIGDVRRDPIGGGVPVDEAIRAEGGSAELIEMDVRRKADCERLIETAVARAGRIDVVIPSQLMAGAASKDLLETTEDDWRLLIDVNLTGTFLVVQAAGSRSSAAPPVSVARSRSPSRVRARTSRSATCGASRSVGARRSTRRSAPRAERLS